MIGCWGGEKLQQACAEQANAMLVLLSRQRLHLPLPHPATQQPLAGHGC